MVGLEQDFETVRKALKNMYMDAGEPDEWAPHWRELDPALDRIEARLRVSENDAYHAEQAFLKMEAERDRLVRERDDCKSFWKLRAGLAEKQRDRLREENDFHKKALEEWNRKAEERLDIINRKVAERDKLQRQLQGHDAVWFERAEKAEAERDRLRKELAEAKRCQDRDSREVERLRAERDHYAVKMAAAQAERNHLHLGCERLREALVRLRPLLAMHSDDSLRWLDSVLEGSSDG